MGKTQPMDASAALYGFMDWLSTREQRSGPFSAHFNPEEGLALVAKFCDAQKLAVLEGDDQRRPVLDALRGNYPD